MPFGWCSEPCAAYNPSLSPCCATTSIPPAITLSLSVLSGSAQPLVFAACTAWQAAAPALLPSPRGSVLLQPLVRIAGTPRCCHALAPVDEIVVPAGAALLRRSRRQPSGARCQIKPAAVGGHDSLLEHAGAAVGQTGTASSTRQHTACLFFLASPHWRPPAQRVLPRTLSTHHPAPACPLRHCVLATAGSALKQCGVQHGVCGRVPASGCCAEQPLCCCEAPGPAGKQGECWQPWSAGRQRQHLSCLPARVAGRSRGDLNSTSVAATSGNESAAQSSAGLSSHPVHLSPVQGFPRGRPVSSAASGGAAPADPEPRPQRKVGALQASLRCLQMHPGGQAGQHGWLCKPLSQSACAAAPRTHRRHPPSCPPACPPARLPDRPPACLRAAIPCRCQFTSRSC
jgi:hypothetical protein